MEHISFGIQQGHHRCKVIRGRCSSWGFAFDTYHRYVLSTYHGYVLNMYSVELFISCIIFIFKLLELINNILMTIL